MEPDGSLETHADLGSLTNHGWNEIVVDGRGNVYVNGPEFDLMAVRWLAVRCIHPRTPGENFERGRETRVSQKMGSGHLYSVRSFLAIALLTSAMLAS